MSSAGKAPGATVALPAPQRSGGPPLTALLNQRHSVREYRAGALTLDDVAQLMWAAQGLRKKGQGRTVPSAGALYPLEVLIVAGDVKGLPDGVYRYAPPSHSLKRLATGDRRAAIAAAAVRQDWIATAPAIIAITAVYQRTTRKYQARGRRYATIEVGHAAQNIYLMVAALRLGTTFVGAFDDDRIAKLLAVPAGEAPLALLPIGRP